MTASQRRHSHHAGLQDTQRAGRGPSAPGLIGDDHLVRRARNGDRQAWNALVDRYAPLIWSICRAYRLGDADAYDVGQNVWLQLVDKVGEVSDPAAPAGWLATITRRECGRVLRAARKSQAARHVLDAGTPDQRRVIAEQELLSAERHAALREAFARLPPASQRLIALLTKNPSPPYAEISAKLGIPVDRIGPTRHHCLDELRRHPAVAALINAEPDSAAGKMHGQAAVPAATQQP
jgi:RNA polymerase sigma factor (sigma-70 family)